MKKFLVLALAVVMLVSLFALTACGKTYQGIVMEADAGYGVVVNVKVSGDKITAIQVLTDEQAAALNIKDWGDNRHAQSPAMTGNGYSWTPISHEALQAWAEDMFVGKTISQVREIELEAQTNVAQEGTVTVATSSQRILDAVINALNNIPKK